MSRKLVVEVIGDATKLVRSFNQSTTAANKFGAEVSGSMSKAEKSFTRMQRVAAGGFIGAAALSAGIVALRRVVDAAAESEQVLGQTRVALESTGQSWTEYGETIEKAITAQSRLGFDDEALLRTFSLFVRQSDDVGEALRRNNIAMDLARARFLDLEQAATLVNKAALGQAGALRRVGIDARTGASGIELLAQLEREFGGAAEEASDTATAAQERLAVSLENVQEEIGRGLLPAVSELASAMSDTADSVAILITQLGRLGDVEIPVIDIPLNFTFPGTDTSAAEFWFKRLSPAGIVFNTKDALGLVADQFRDQPVADVNTSAKAFEAGFDTFLEGLEKGRKNVERKAKKFGEEGFRPLPSSARERADLATEALLESLSLDLRRTGITESLADDNRVLAEIQTELRKAIARGSLIEGLQAQLIDTQIQIANNRASATADAASEKANRAQDRRDKANQAAADRARAAAKRLLETQLATAREQARQFRAIGLTSEGEQPLPGMKNLRKQFEQLSDNVIGQNVPKKLLNRLALVGKALHGGIKKLEDPTIRAIQDLFGEIRDTFDKEAQEGPITKTTTLNAGKILKGLGLSPEEIRELRARLSSFNSAGVALSGGNRPTGGFQSQTRFVVENQNTITMDGEVVARNTTKSQQKRKRRNPTQKRGPNGGV